MGFRTGTDAGGSSGPLNNFAAVVPPTASDDSGSSYSVGSRWVDVSEDQAWICLDATPAAAVWKPYAGALNKYDGTTAPTANEDSGDGYSVGSMWFDTTNDKAYACLDATAAAAVWIESAISDHGGLSGLGDDDHTQYILADGTRAFSGNVDLGTNNITNVGTITAVTGNVTGTLTPSGILNLTTGSTLVKSSSTDPGSPITGEVYFNVDTNTLRRYTNPTWDDINGLNNYAATTAPTTTDDTPDYEVGSLWFDTTNDKAYACLDATASAAVWTEITASGATDHGALTGLTDDDHVRYFDKDGSKAMTGDLDMGSNNITSAVNITATGDIDFSGADLVIESGTADPGSPTTGQVYIKTDETPPELRRYNGATWDVIGDGTGGDVTGPGSSTDNAIARFDGAGGKTLQDSSVLIDDSDNMTGLAGLTMSGDIAMGANDITNAATVGASTVTSTAITATGDVDFSGADLIIESATIDPTLPSTGQIYIKTNETPPELRRYNGATWDVIGDGTGGGADEKVGVSADDTTPDYLLNKLTAGENVTLTETTPGGDETITIDAGKPNNYVATAAPTVTDDTPDYEVGSFWYDTTNNEAWTCVDNTSGNAEWRAMNGISVVGSLPTAIDELIGTFASLTTDPGITQAQLYQCIDNEGSPSWEKIAPQYDAAGKIVDRMSFSSAGQFEMPDGSSNPGSPTSGDFFYHTTDLALRRYNGSAWIDVGTNQRAYVLNFQADYDNVGWNSAPLAGTLEANLWNADYGSTPTFYAKSPSIHFPRAATLVSVSSRVWTSVAQATNALSVGCWILGMTEGSTSAPTGTNVFNTAITHTNADAPYFDDYTLSNTAIAANEQLWFAVTGDNASTSQVYGSIHIVWTE